MQTSQKAFGQNHGSKAIITVRVPWGLEVTSSITAIVVSYNSAEVLPGCIEALREGLAPDQVLVVDNASGDKSVAVAHDLEADVIANRVNVGFGAGCNIGAQEANCELLLFVNPDVRIESVDSTKLSELTSLRPFGLLAPRALLTTDSEHEDPSRRRILPWPCDIVREALGPVLPHEISDRLFALLARPGKQSWLSGALLFAARHEFLGIGGFDERLFLYYEDQELSRRYARQGIPLTTTDAIAARHVRGGSSNAIGTLRPVPRAASAISSIELAGIMHGTRAARCAWWLYRALSRLAATLVCLASRGPLATRGLRKRDELRGTAYAAVRLLEEPSPHYPLVKMLARRSRWVARARARRGDRGA